ncbi:uncharacterized protein BO95DRAFT_199184 [Aspergillus brunneoviolaceus CBS 621.78]|uniref:Uncharacterized protein n=1 Tax=Aspergillus brunneoviolaceus CBS 621.78 TaxID=1450534 RepID=A0ACD1G3E7_9EURO|nr:hypothetical protein BO95DRAFT_199184 [Aspergillus brunneoviolaceus CBS 621.78]RAH43799.1 hypothetical protein BO95DRAFT_199184 [Aspergillus brunneoviolaceus CBS 621.78]
MLLPRCPPNRILSTGKRFSPDPLWPPALPYLPDRIGFGNGEIAQLLLHLRVLAVHCIRLQIRRGSRLLCFSHLPFLRSSQQYLPMSYVWYSSVHPVTSRNQEPQKKRDKLAEKRPQSRGENKGEEEEGRLERNLLCDPSSCCPHRGESGRSPLQVGGIPTFVFLLQPRCTVTYCMLHASSDSSVSDAGFVCLV